MTNNNNNNNNNNKNKQNKNKKKKILSLYCLCCVAQCIERQGYVLEIYAQFNYNLKMSRRQTVLQQDDKKKKVRYLDRGRQTVGHIDNRTEQNRTAIQADNV